MASVRKTFVINNINWLQKYIDAEDEVIDFGCGLMPTTRKLQCKKLIGIDAWPPYIEKLRNELIHLEHIYLWHLDLGGTLLSAANSNSTDVSVALDVVEHFEKDAALNLIQEIERIARKRVIILTPNGFLPQEREENSEYQRHRCGFIPAEFEEMGYNVFYRVNLTGMALNSFLAVKEL